MFVADRAETYLAPVIPGEISLVQNLLLIFIIAGLIEKSDDILFGFIKRDGSGKLFPTAIGIFAAGVGFTVIAFAGILVLPEGADIDHFGKDFLDLFTVGQAVSVQIPLIQEVESQLVSTDDRNILAAGSLEHLAGGN